MNKILMDGDKLYYKSDIESIEVKGSSTIYIKDIDNYKIEITLKDNAELNIYVYTECSGEANINIHQGNNSTVNFIHTFKIDGDYKLKYLTDISGNNNKNNVYISGVSKNNVSLDVDGKVLTSTKENELNESIRVLTIDGKCFVAPKLHINTLDVIANHNTAISNIREEELFYLMSKGIDEVSASSLIEESYYLGYLKEKANEFYKYIKSE